MPDAVVSRSADCSTADSPSADSLRADVVLEARGLSRRFRSGLRVGRVARTVSAVDDVSFVLRRGESLGLVGESGCGKSTLARMLVGLERPDDGTLLLSGQDVTRPGRAQRALMRRSVQMVFQDPYTSLDPRSDVEALVGEPLATGPRKISRSARRDRVVELLEQVGLSGAMLGRHPHEFSGGQRQRIGIARALAVEPEVLVCDEPVSALDLSVQAQVVNLLRSLQQQTGVALLFIAHDLSVVRHVADRTMVMYLGRLTETGPTPAVFDDSAHPYTRSLLSAVPVLDRRRRGGLSRRTLLAGDPPSPVDPPSGCRFHTRCPIAVDRCAQAVPPLEPIDGGNHSASCWRADEVRLTSSSGVHDSESTSVTVDSMLPRVARL